MPSYESGNFKFNYTGSFPDQIKLIKTVTAFPFEITATGSLNPRSQKWNYTIGCRVSSSVGLPASSADRQLSSLVALCTGCHTKWQADIQC